MTKLRYALFGGTYDERTQLVQRFAGGELHLGPGKVEFGVLLAGDAALSPVELKARVAELAGAPLFVVGPPRIDHAVRAVRLGATDYLPLPLTPEALEARVREQLETTPPQAQVKKSDLLIGSSPAMARLLAQIELYGAGSEPVLVLGESGTGKELVARALHQASPRRERPLHAINCSTIVDTLAESELFGAKKGSFTGATVDRAGLFVAAHQSTLFLDEIGTSSPALQAKLLRVLESGEFLSIGSASPTRVDVRIVAATNADLPEARANKQFRDDLYYRLAGAVIDIPPLRERLEDLPLLIAHHLTVLAARMRKPVPRLDPDALARLRAHRWPGNVRELVHLLANALTVCTGNVIHAGDLPLRETAQRSATAVESYERAKDAFERAYVEQLLRATAGNVSEAARLAGRTRKDMYKLFERAGLDPETFRSG